MEPQILIILGLSLLAGSAIGFLLGRHAAPWMLYLFWALLAAFVVSFTSDPIMDLMGLPNNGFDRLGYVAVATLFVIPALIGAVCVGLPTLIRRRRRESRD